MMVLHEGPKSLQNKITLLDRSRIHVFSGLMGSKYIYTKTGTSPTKWAYAHTDSPELPPEWINSTTEIANNYKAIEQSLNYLAEFIKNNPGSRFVRSSDLVESVAPSSYFQVGKEQLDVLARWLILKWDEGRPPNYVSDGENFYSLRDLLVLLSKALANGMPDVVALSLAYGPVDEGQSFPTATLSSEDIYAIADKIAGDISETESASWSKTPKSLLPVSFSIRGTSINLAQLLYAMAYIYASTYAGKPMAKVTVPQWEMLPETAELLKNLNCLTYPDTSWSLKPSRIHPIP